MPEPIHRRTDLSRHQIDKGPTVPNHSDFLLSVTNFHHFPENSSLLQTRDDGGRATADNFNAATASAMPQFHRGRERR